MSRAKGPLLTGFDRVHQISRFPFARKLTYFVDPFIGTDGTGHTFPGPSRPFGMVQPGPDNAGGGWAFTSGYQYQSPIISGFSQNRASGTGIPELGDVLIQPSQTRRDDLGSRYEKSSEMAKSWLLRSQPRR